MTFYQMLTPYYDEIFPANEKQINFIVSYLKKGSSILDVGAGTGNVAQALAEKGLIVTAMEPEESLAARIRKKASVYEGRFSVNTFGMQEIENVPEVFDCIYCIGNTLVHLNNKKEIFNFICGSYKKLKADGKLIIQIVNYEKVLTGNDFKFPVIEKKHFSFKRDYMLEEEKVLFTATLNVDDKELANSILLYPITKQQLLSMLKECGFRTVETFGNFKKEAYLPNGQALVLVATK
ncbi:class I SAM-dependent methyltransferase [Bacillus wiedmannii]|uniref:class I SAM-dependent methyltransferase n=1 Tax=Bacillus wiedmannii TaxID=1890302 RepID=UPI0021D0A1D1|nr:class I SAM-dependent methyltransferase [Bacillus wiedmannii]MCU5577196.1 class I SAM-dependent methyltransferase [Bacillus wiedmannii]